MDKHFVYIVKHIIMLLEMTIVFANPQIRSNPPVVGNFMVAGEFSIIN